MPRLNLSFSGAKGDLCSDDGFGCEMRIRLIAKALTI